MADIKISELPSAAAVGTSVVPVSNAAGTATNKVTLAAIAALSAGSGATGVTGATGVAGVTGVTGVTGVQGVTGVTGATGVAGVTGATGAQGTTGVTGVTGAAGVTGATGVNGADGATGATGPQGATGANFTLPTATSSVLGGIKIGSGLTITDGVLAATGGGGGGGAGSDSRWDLFLPPAPTSVSATSGNEQAAVVWTAPTGVLSQTPVTDYVVQYQPSGGAWTTFSDSTSMATSATVTGLTNDTAYTFRVAAVNGVGQGAYSTVSASVTPSAAPPALLLIGPNSGDNGDAPTDSGPAARSLGGNAIVNTYYGDPVVGYRAGQNGNWRCVFFGGRTLTFADLSLGTSNFTFETWLCVPDFFGFQSNNCQIFGNSVFSFNLEGSGSSKLRLSVNGSTVAASTSDALGYNSWTHVALSRSGNTVYLHANGSRVASATVTDSFSGSSMLVGSFGCGMMSNIRICSAAIYTGATYTIPTPPL